MERRLLNYALPALLVVIAACFGGELFAEAFGRNGRDIFHGIVVGAIAGLMGWVAWRFDLSRDQTDQE